MLSGGGPCCAYLSFVRMEKQNAKKNDRIDYDELGQLVSEVFAEEKTKMAVVVIHALTACASGGEPELDRWLRCIPFSHLSSTSARKCEGDAKPSAEPKT